MILLLLSASLWSVWPLALHPSLLPSLEVFNNDTSTAVCPPLVCVASSSHSILPSLLPSLEVFNNDTTAAVRLPLVCVASSSLSILPSIHPSFHPSFLRGPW